MARVLALEWWTDDLFELVVEKQAWSYRAGECTLLIHSDHIASRPYSFSSHPEQGELRFLVRALRQQPHGFSQWLASRQPGDEIGVGTPFGLFSPGHSDREVWMATGTGVAPFLSCLRGKTVSSRPNLYWGLRTSREALVADFLAQKCEFQLILSREQSRQHVTTARADFPWGGDREYFLCGNGAMVSRCRSELLEGHVEPSRIFEEKFFA